VEKGIPLVELETNKVTIEVRAPATGILTDIFAAPGNTVKEGEDLCSIKSLSS
jgi:2-oxoglutarate dehydrogenase E2 component (dihydrolipoamide succinyltransferase)